MFQQPSQSEPPLLLIWIVGFGLAIIVLIFGLWWAKEPAEIRMEMNSDHYFLEAKNEPVDYLQFFQENYLISKAPPFLVEGKVLASIGEADPISEKDKILMAKIIECESHGDAGACNKEFGCDAGMGLCGLIPMTVKECSDAFGRQIYPFNPEDNLECCYYLLKTYGTDPWGTADTWWGSYWCWSK